MICFICERDRTEIMLVKVPIEVAYENYHFEIVGNAIEGEYICLSCIGFQYDLLERSEPKC